MTTTRKQFALQPMLLKSRMMHVERDRPTPAKPRRTRIPRLVKLRRENGCQAVRGTKKIPYAIEEIEIKLKEIAVANGAPIKPRAMGSGPQTESQGQ
jgi:hypothetical protein